MEDNLKKNGKNLIFLKMEDDLTKNGRQPKKINKNELNGRQPTKK
jgi:hypothetical protein